ncbi:hypothetical protein BRADI_2g37487v3 [Brachypodium distachyon]|uniref:DUF3741 domain-containing protein n=1 Tax=Brachypodium distachyon TaxID=15368 RepID=A0A2K2DCD3_BRADI|nr:hypothetical protein BRADI_2g37487v3 [Brachypodium distachyon]
MLRGGAGSRAAAAAKPPRRPPVPSRRARGAAAARESSKDGGGAASVLEDPVVSSVEESSFTFEFKRGPKRARKGMPPAETHGGKENWGEGFTAKTHVVKEAPKEVEFTHCAPGIVARLMGLDTVPRSKKVLDRCQSDIQSNMRQKLSGGVQEVARASCDDRPCRSSADELPELKDVFEVTEMENMAMRKALQSGNEKPRLRSDNADLEFVRQKFLDAKRLSTDEGHRSSKEFSEALEILYSKKDVFLEILQENSTALSGFPGHILGYSGSQCDPHASNGAGLQLFEQDNLHSMEVESESDNLAPKGRKSSGRSSQIVVLKPNLQRTSATPVSSSDETLQFGQWPGTQFLKPSRRSMYKQDSMHSTAPNSFQVLESAGDTPELKVIKQTPKRCSRRKPSGVERYLAVGCQREKVALTSHDETLPVSSSAHPAGSSVSRKARKHLSERWQMACQSSAENSVPTDTRTLGEMLELTDRDTAKVTTQKSLPDQHVKRNNAQEIPASPLGISSKDGWKAGIYCEDDSRGGTSRNFPRSKSLPASSTPVTKLQGRRRSAPSPNLPILKDILNAPTDESGNAHVRKRSSIRKAKPKNGRVIFHAGKENMLPEKEIYVTSEQTRHSVCISDLPRTINIYNNDHASVVISTEDNKSIDSAIPHDDVQNFQVRIGCTEQKLAESFPELEEVNPITIHNHDNTALKEGESQSLESYIAEVDHQAVNSAHTASPVCSQCSSPTASLQQDSGEETAYSGIFKSINFGIQGKHIIIHNPCNSCVPQYFISLLIRDSHFFS